MLFRSGVVACRNLVSMLTHANPLTPRVFHNLLIGGAVRHGTLIWDRCSIVFLVHSFKPSQILLGIYVFRDILRRGPFVFALSPVKPSSNPTEYSVDAKLSKLGLAHPNGCTWDSLVAFFVFLPRAPTICCTLAQAKSVCLGGCLRTFCRGRDQGRT
jgi:hypothetical protein